MPIMLKMTVRPLDSTNSSIPNRTPLSVEMTINSSMAHSLNDPLMILWDRWRGWSGKSVRCEAPDQEPGARSSRREEINRSGPLHVAGGRQHRLCGIDFGYQIPAPAGALLVVRVLCL